MEIMEIDEKDVGILIDLIFCMAIFAFAQSAETSEAWTDFAREYRKRVQRERDVPAVLDEILEKTGNAIFELKGWNIDADNKEGEYDKDRDNM
jgi:hypothetical protein